jgi:site-specific recombinase XerD
MSARVSLQARVEQYLAERRRVGFELSTMGHGLVSFASHVQAAQHRGPLTVDLMAAWARQAKGGHGDRATSARRLKMLRPFTRWLRQFEPATEVPDEAVFGAVPGRMTPHVYREPEIIELLAAARKLGPDGGLRPLVMETLFGLIACTGLRISEALGLLDTDPAEQVRQVPAGAAAPERHRGAGTLPNAASPACAQHARVAVLRRQSRALAGPAHRRPASSPHLRGPAKTTRLG